MLSKKISDNISEQIKWELYSAYLYVGMAAYAASIGLRGFSNWFNVQVKEELIHAEKFYNYLVDQGGKITLKAIDEPPQDFKSAADLFEKTLEHEKKVTKRINDLAGKAQKENDNATNVFLQWFITEQIEEEANAGEILQKLKLAGKSGDALLMIDSQLAARTFVPPQAPAA